MGPRIKNIHKKIEKNGLDALLVSSPANISYLTEFNSRDAYLLISGKENIYITDSRYTQEAKEYLDKGFRVKKINGSAFRLIAGLCLKLGLGRVGFEERHLIFGEHKKIQEELDASVKLVPTHSLIEGLRAVKDAQELEKIRNASQIAISALNFIEEFIRPGKKEIEAAGELERFIRYHGASSSAFDIIVASGPNSSFPHHITSHRKIKSGETVLVDIGVDYLGYKSDLTRVFFLDKINNLARKIYDVVLKAQDLAIKKIEPGIEANKIDSAARQYITEKGYGGFFSHSLGHGVGLEVHEEPHICGKARNRIKPGMVFTVEPAVYLPHKFGIRIEDMVLVTENGAKVLSGTLNK